MGGYTASSYLGPGFEPWRASILSSSKQDGWCADDSTPQYLQIDLGSVHHVTGILTRGLTAGIVKENAWVEKYTVQYSVLGGIWIDHKEQELNKVRGTFFASSIQLNVCFSVGLGFSKAD